MLWDIGDALELKLRGSTVLTMRVPETPPDLPLDCQHSGGVLVGEPTRLTGAAGAAIREKV
jgi:hypothetical protein